KKILIIRLSALGDVLLTTPVIRSLKNNYSHISIDFLVKENFKDAVNLNPNINDVFIYNESSELTEKLKQNNYDLVIDLQNNFRSKKIVKELELPFYKFVKPTLEKFLLVKFKINMLKDLKPIPERYAKFIPDLVLDEKSPELFIPDSIKSDIDQEEKVIGLCPGAFHFTKRWPLLYYADLGKRMADNGHRIILLGGKSDRPICSDLQKMIPNSIDLSNDNDLFQTAAHMKNCKAVVCNDSGLMHTATALEIPVVSIFGSTVKEFGFVPYKAKNLIVENLKLKCRPCTHIGRSKCPKVHFNCMTEITPDIVYNEFQKFLGEL
ncbi:MAG: lipopolysaccharide heptosyltransferase II, partial [Bacteroidota bacterium]